MSTRRLAFCLLLAIVFPVLYALADPAPVIDGSKLQITPMEPPPPPLRPKDQPGDERRVVTRDLVTGTTTERTIETLEDLLGPRYTEAGVGVVELLEDPEGVAKYFQDWVRVDDPTAGDYPRRVKLFMNFRTPEGVLIDSCGCSGTLIDPKHVLTAAHCVYSHELYESGTVINNYAESISVIPAYNDGEMPYGDAHAVALHVWLNWKDDYDYDHDIGIIDLDRPIGALTGWWGYGFSEGDCDFWESWTWRHEGYPGGDVSDGRSLYANIGDFDDCEANGWDNRALWYGPTAKGTSGAGAVKVETGAAYAVYSTGDEVIISVDCKLTPVKYAAIGQFLAEDHPPALDLVAMFMKGPAQVVSGYRPNFLNFVVVNYSSAAQSGTWTYSLYLSTDDQITGADTFLGSQSFTHPFVPDGAVRVEVDTPPLIPADTPGGNYYLGALLTVGDYEWENNDSSGQEAWPIQVLCPDAVAPTQLGPWNGMTCGNLTQFFSWNATAPAADYQLQVGTSCGTGTVIDTRLNYWTWPGLAYDTTYYWRVRASAQCGGWGPWSDCWSFSTAPDLSVQLAAVSPADGQHCLEEGTVVTWQAFPEAQGYEFRMAMVCGEGAVRAVTGNSAPVITKPGTEYFWSVRAQTSCGSWTAWSPCYSFKTAPTWVATPVLFFPGDATACVPADPHLIWTADPEADSYDVQVGTECGSGTLYRTTGHNYALSGLEDGVTYYWRVRTHHECGLVSPWSDCWSFGVDAVAPSPPPNLAPSHPLGAWSTDNTIFIGWDPSSDDCDEPGYSFVFDRLPDTIPDDVKDDEEPDALSGILGDGPDHWFHVKAIDGAGNSSETVHLGPFWIDATPPTTPTLDYATLDPGQVIGPTTLVVDWLAASDATSGVAGYSWITGNSSTPPPTLDRVVDGTNLWGSAPVGGTGSVWFFVRAVDAAGNGGGHLALGPFTVSPYLLGLYLTEPARDEVLTEGEVYRIRWDLYDNGSYGPQGVDLAYSLDGAQTFLPIASIPVVQVYMGYYDWTVPMAASGEAVVRLTVTDATGGAVYDRSVRFTLEQVTTVGELPPADRCVLAAARPNPFNPQTTIEYAVPRGMNVSLRIFDLQGRLVRTLADGWREGPAWYAEDWDGRDAQGLTVASGVYRYLLEAGTFRQSRSLVLLK